MDTGASRTQHLDVVPEVGDPTERDDGDSICVQVVPSSLRKCSDRSLVAAALDEDRGAWLGRNDRRHGLSHRLRDIAGGRGAHGRQHAAPGHPSRIVAAQRRASVLGCSSGGRRSRIVREGSVGDRRRGLPGDDMSGAGRSPKVLVVGAGPAGLAVAACLQRRRIGGVVLERHGSVGASWRERYDRLHLHTPRVQSHLPGHRIPRRYGRWVSRDDVVAYLEDYARHHRILPRFGVTVERIDPVGVRWRVRTSEGPLESDVVVLTTGYNAVPRIPDWPGLADFEGAWLHSSTYRSGRDYAGRDVLVVGTGNTGAEIAVDLVEQGAERVRLAVRTPPHIVPRAVAGIPTTLLGIPNQFLPAWLADPGNTLLQRLTVGDLSAFGLPRPADGLVARFRRTDVVPIIDVGLVEQLRAGRVRVVAEVVGFDQRKVHLADGTHLEPDVVIAATGYRTGLQGLIGHLGVLDRHGRPAVAPGRAHPRAPGLYYVGLRNPLIGLLNSIRLDARRVARAVSGQR